MATSNPTFVMPKPKRNYQASPQDKDRMERRKRIDDIADRRQDKQLLKEVWDD